jgi:hypothetical protein
MTERGTLIVTKACAWVISPGVERPGNLRPKVSAGLKHLLQRDQTAPVQDLSVGFVLGISKPLRLMLDESP